MVTINNHEKPIQLFGDESNSAGIITYAFIIVPSAQLNFVEAEIARVKSNIGLEPNAEIHCREIFHYHPRQKTAFKNFNTDQILEFLGTLMMAIYESGARGWIGYMDTRSAPEIMHFKGFEKGEVNSWNVNDKKLQMLFAYYAAMSALTNIVPPANIVAWVDGDKKTKVKHFNKSAKVDRMKRFFPINHNDQIFEPVAVYDNKPVLLQIADVLAYSAAQGLSSTYTKYKENFVSLVNAFVPGYSEVLFGIQNDGAMMTARTYDPRGSIGAYLRDALIKGQ